MCRDAALSLSAVALLLSLSFGSAAADEYVWTGDSPDGNHWLWHANWLDNRRPPLDGSKNVTVVFSGSPARDVDQNTHRVFALNKLLFAEDLDFVDTSGERVFRITGPSGTSSFDFNFQSNTAGKAPEIEFNTSDMHVIIDGNGEIRAEKNLSITGSGEGRLTIDRAMSLHESLLVDFAGTLELRKPVWVRWQTTLSSGTLEMHQPHISSGSEMYLRGGTLRATGPFTLPNFLDILHGTIDIPDFSHQLTLGGFVFSDADASLRKIGLGTVSLNRQFALNRIRGTLNIEEGTVRLTTTKSEFEANFLDDAIVLLQGGALDVSTFESNTVTLGGLGGSSDIDVGTRTLRVGTRPHEGPLEYSGTIVAGRLVKVGDGEWVLSGSNRYGGGTTIEGGTLVVHRDESLGVDGTTLGDVAIMEGATLRAAASFESHRSLVLTGSGTIDVEAGQTLALWGGLSGSGDLTKSGLGVLHLAVDEFTGTAFGDEGTLFVDEGTLRIATTGNGTALGNVHVHEEGTFAFGASPDVIESGDVVWQGGGRWEWEIDDALGGAGAGWDLWRMDSLSIEASAENPFYIALNPLGDDGDSGEPAGFDPFQDYTWQIVGTTNGISGFHDGWVMLDTQAFHDAANGGAFALFEAGGGLHVTFTPVPEPGSWALLASGAATLALVRLRRRAARRRKAENAEAAT